MSDNTDAKNKFTIGTVTLLLVPVMIVVNGYVLSVMWNWFCVPLGMIQIGAAHALGISVLANHILAGRGIDST